MPYLSKIPLNPLRWQTQRLLQSPQAMHAAVLGGLPPAQDGRVLWREEVSRRTDGPITCHVLVLTPEEPDWSHLVENAGWSTEAGAPLIRSLQPLLDLVATGREFGFKVRANPVQSTLRPERPTAGQRRALEEPRRGVRVAHRTAGHQLDWFRTRTAPDDPKWGFTVADDPVLNVSVVGREHLTFTKGREQRHRVTLDRVTYEGRLTVTDPVRLREVLTQGLGRAKAYGCGLLTLAPAVH